MTSLTATTAIAGAVGCIVGLLGGVLVGVWAAKGERQFHV